MGGNCKPGQPEYEAGVPNIQRRHPAQIRNTVKAKVKQLYMSSKNIKFIRYISDFKLQITAPDQSGVKCSTIQTNNKLHASL
jgi:hypothetical protein